MRYKVFVDTNILLSGIFFEGNESKVLDLVELDIVTSKDVVDELQKVVRNFLQRSSDRSNKPVIRQIMPAILSHRAVTRVRLRSLLPRRTLRFRHGV